MLLEKKYASKKPYCTNSFCIVAMYVLSTVVFVSMPEKGKYKNFSFLPGHWYIQSRCLWWGCTEEAEAWCRWWNTTDRRLQSGTSCWELLLRHGWCTGRVSVCTDDCLNLLHLEIIYGVVSHDSILIRQGDILLWSAHRLEREVASHHCSGLLVDLSTMNEKIATIT